MSYEFISLRLVTPFLLLVPEPVRCSTALIPQSVTKIGEWGDMHGTGEYEDMYVEKYFWNGGPWKNYN